MSLKTLRQVLYEADVDAADNETTDKEDVIETLESLLDGAENDVEETLIEVLIELIDVDMITPEGFDVIFDAILELDDDEDVEESITEQFKRVVRNGRKIRKRVCKAGYKSDGTRCVKMGATELRNRRRSAKKSAIKKKGRRKQIARKAQLTRKRFNV